MSSIVTAVAQGEAHALPIAQPEDGAQVRGHYRHTKIVVTVGPATESDEQIRRLIDSGVDMLRLNMAHATADWVKTVVARIREVSAEAKRHVAVMMDVKGPEIRTGLVSEGIDLKAGEIFEFYTQTPTEGVRGIDVNYPGLPLDVQVGATVLVDSGLIRLEIVAKDDTHVRCRVLVPGRLGRSGTSIFPACTSGCPRSQPKTKRIFALGPKSESTLLRCLLRGKERTFRSCGGFWMNWGRGHASSPRSRTRLACEILRPSCKTPTQ